MGLIVLFMALGLVVVCWPIIVGALYVAGWAALIIGVPLIVLACVFGLLRGLWKAIT